MATSVLANSSSTTRDRPLRPQNLPEFLIWYYILGTYLIYLCGAQYLLAPCLATGLTAYLLFKYWTQTEATPESERITISWPTWMWILAILVIGVVTLAGHISLELGPVDLIRALLLWYITWGLLALFVLVGHLNIRPQLIYRATSILCLQSLLVTAIGTAADLLNLPTIGYESPLNVMIRVAGGAPEQFYVNLFHSISNTRLTLFGVWPTFTALLGNIYFFFALEESDKKWRWVGLVGSIVLILGSRSRLATLCLPVVLVTVWILTNFFRPWVQIVAGFVCGLVGVFATTLVDTLVLLRAEFDKVRSGSSEVRETLYRISLERWWSESPIWGLTQREKGPFLVSRLPLGSHHTWIGVLYSYGLVGASVLAVAFLCSFIDLVIKAQRSRLAKTGLSVLLVLFVCSFADNIEFFAYLFWPGLVVMGIAFKERIVARQPKAS
ncbi:O-antigen ligase family protein [Leptolyngbya sp. NK1-12]|uniref:O-antigen ligase family protein n=1 Tax=Leptolyngbya sp. NK1-12 TaxID=2547451 RepID=A0AA97AQM0_9CYAN|nr:O-antigen ligase family protein [Leptolyngbya sp. NK1-12]